MQARYYDPVVGRFYSNDPIGFRDVHSFNRYTYANNNPYKYTDPDGKNPRINRRIKPIAKAVAEAIGGKKMAAQIEARFTLMNPRSSVKEMSDAINTVRPKVKMPTKPSQVKHIFDKKKVNDGHIAPTTEASKQRAGKMFENVASDSKNKVSVTNPHKQKAGIESFEKKQNNGTVWVETRKDVIQNAGVDR